MLNTRGAWNPLNTILLFACLIILLATHSAQTEASRYNNVGLIIVLTTYRSQNPRDTILHSIGLIIQW